MYVSSKLAPAERRGARRPRPRARAWLRRRRLLNPPTPPRGLDSSAHPGHRPRSTRGRSAKVLSVYKPTGTSVLFAKEITQKFEATHHTQANVFEDDIVAKAVPRHARRRRRSRTSPARAAAPRARQTERARRQRGAAGAHREKRSRPARLFPTLRMSLRPLPQPCAPRRTLPPPPLPVGNSRRR